MGRIVERRDGGAGCRRSCRTQRDAIVSFVAAGPIAKRKVRKPLRGRVLNVTAVGQGF
jgi:hypothetical protein